jgi:hypothetical protein
VLCKDGIISRRRWQWQVTRLGPDAVALQPRSKNRVNGNDKWDKVTKLLIKTHVLQ